MHRFSFLVSIFLCFFFLSFGECFWVITVEARAAHCFSDRKRYTIMMYPSYSCIYFVMLEIKATTVVDETRPSLTVLFIYSSRLKICAALRFSRLTLGRKIAPCQLGLQTTKEISHNCFDENLSTVRTHRTAGSWTCAVMDGGGGRGVSVFVWSHRILFVLKVIPCCQQHHTIS